MDLMKNFDFRKSVEDRMVVMYWWNKKKETEKKQLADKYREMLFGREFAYLTGREIENIYNKENDTPA
jgi:hypothetical protein